MNAELKLYAQEIRHLLDRLCRAIEGLDEAQLNWRPSAAETNSIFVIATHILGNLEAWVLGIACGQPIERDRPAEFAASGSSAEPVVARAQELRRRFDGALRALPPERLDEMAAPSKLLWGEGTPRPISGREALMHTVEHAAMHLGQIDITKDLVLAGEKS